MQARNEFDSTIQETEAAYMKVRVLPFCSSKRGGAVVETGPRHLALLSHRLPKLLPLLLPQILESSQTLLTVLKREATTLQKKKQTTA
jgi:hypothetical protein